MPKNKDPKSATPAACVLDRTVGRPEPGRGGLLTQIEACRRAVAKWPAWMRATSSAPKWMEGWDDA